MPGSILIVDDNPQNIQVLGSILQHIGYVISVALNGQDALDYLRDKSVDLILLDVMMPGMTGYEVCERLAQQPRTNAIPVIFLTAKSESEDVLKGFEVGGVDFISKPFQAAELLARVKTHIALNKARREISRLQGILPICASCRKIRDDKGYWKQVDEYFAAHSDLRFSHGICQECVKTLYPEIAGMIDSSKTDPEVD